MDSRIEGFYKSSPDERLAEVAERADLSAAAEDALSDVGLDAADAEQVSENVVGTVEYPLSVATNFVVNDEDAERRHDDSITF